jgi:tetratricopeptide (TPR) repeat protein
LYQGKLNLSKSQLEQAMSTSDSASERAAYAIEIAGIVYLLRDANSARSLISQNIDKDTLDTTRIAAARILATLGARQDVNSLLASIHPTKSMLQGIGPANKNFIDGQLSLAEGKTAEAIRFLNDSYEQDDDPETAYFLARAHIKAGDWQTAFGLLDGAVKHKGRLLLDSSAHLWPLAVYYLAVCEDKLGQKEKALQSYETFLQLWEGADAALAEPRLAQRRYKELQATPQWRDLPQ